MESAVNLFNPLSACRCVACLIPLPDTYYEDNNQPYCMEHFYENSAHKCGKCLDYITGPTMVIFKYALVDLAMCRLH